MYYLHRISNEWEVARKLFDMGYLSIGWKDLKHRDLSEWRRFSEAFAECYGNARGKQGLWRFLHFQPGDTVIVPLYEKQFAIVTVHGETAPATALPPEVRRDAGLTDDIDIGFCVHVKDCKLIPRAYAPAVLQSRMKIRQTNADISDLAEAVEAARHADSSINLQKVIRENVTTPMLESIRQLTDTQFERLVKWYMEKIGADRAYVLNKNSCEKVEYEDADVRAEFDALGVVVLIQAKQHTGCESVWAVEQISKYLDLRIDPADDNIYIPWVITTADGFDEKALAAAGEKRVRLIDGAAFAQRLLDVGIKDITSITAAG